VTAIGVGIVRCTFSDTSRGLLDYATNPPTPLLNRRILMTEIRYPTHRAFQGEAETLDARPAVRPGGYPAIVFAHGYDITPDAYAPLLDAWVKAGFVVIAPIFPGEKPAEVTAQRANTEQDLLNEPADIVFVTDQVLRAETADASGCRLPHSLIDASRLALAGHSDGAEVVAMLAYSLGKDPQGVSYRSLRSSLDFRATLVLSGQEDGIDAYGLQAPATAMFMVQSLADQCNSPSNAETLYRAIDEQNKWFLELKNAHHLPPFDNVDVPAFQLVAATTTRFLENLLYRASSARALFVLGNAQPAIGALFEGGSGPTLGQIPPSNLPCGPN
jgi:hypothetical protein